MAVTLENLDAQFATTVQRVLDNCANRGIIMRPYCTIRTPFEQAILWRQSRSTEEIRSKIQHLEDNNARFLAHCIESVGSQNGRPVTQAIPGLSWHQWGEAVDCFWLVDRSANWSARQLINNMNGYQVYAAESQRMGLEAGGLWRNFKDWPHIQLRKDGSPLRNFTLSEISDEMEKDFG